MNTKGERGDIAILPCEQYFDFARALADKFIVLSRGEVVASGASEQMDSDDVTRYWRCEGNGFAGWLV